MEYSVVEALRFTWSNVERRLGAGVAELWMTTQNNCSTFGYITVPSSPPASTRRGTPPWSPASRCLQRASLCRASSRSARGLSRMRLRSSVKAASFDLERVMGLIATEENDPRFQYMTARMSDYICRTASLGRTGAWTFARTGVITSQTTTGEFRRTRRLWVTSSLMRMYYDIYKRRDIFCLAIRTRTSIAAP